MTARRGIGTVSADRLKRLVQGGDVDTVAMCFTDHYGRLLGKRLDAEHVLRSKAMTGGTHVCDYLLANDMDMNPVPGYAFASFERGYGDLHLVPDPSTLMVAPWLDRTAMVLCDLARDGRPVSLSPRTMLQDQIRHLQPFTAEAASELEYYTYSTTYRDAHDAEYRRSALETTGRHVQDYHLMQSRRDEPVTGAARRALRQAGFPMEGSKGEAAVGQQELNYSHSEALLNCDRHVILKQCVKETADEQQCAVTFMAKPFHDCTGSGFHVHFNLVEQGKNAFVGADGCRSDTFRWFLGGWMRYTRDLMPFYAPTVNAYKRFVSESWAPTQLSWSTDNRTASFRVVGQGQSLRIEFRVCGADANPYLALAASIAAGRQGIQERIEPPEETKGNAYASSDPTLLVPQSLREATACLDSSSFARSAFGDDVIDHYVHFYRHEARMFDAAVTDWERKQYFERI